MFQAIGWTQPPSAESADSIELWLRHHSMLVAIVILLTGVGVGLWMLVEITRWVRGKKWSEAWTTDGLGRRDQAFHDNAARLEELRGTQALTVPVGHWIPSSAGKVWHLWRKVLAQREWEAVALADQERRRARDVAIMAVFREEHRKDRYTLTQEVFEEDTSRGHHYVLTRGDWRMRLGEDQTKYYRPTGKWWDGLAAMALELRPLSIERWIPEEGSFGKWHGKWHQNDAPYWRSSKPKWEDWTQTTPRVEETPPEITYTWEGQTFWVRLYCSPDETRCLLKDIMDRIQEQAILDDATVSRISGEVQQALYGRHTP